MKLLNLIFIMVILLFSFSCQKKKTDNTDSISDMSIQDGGTLVVGASAELGNVNPLTSVTTIAGNAIGQFFLTLVKRDKDLSLVPSLAESWEFSPDFLSITYRLRKDVLWSDGKPFTAKDVKYSYYIYTHPDINYRGISEFEFIKDVVVIDDYTVKFVFKEVYADELPNSGESINVLPSHILEKMTPKEITKTDFFKNPVVCGPFKMEKWEPNIEWSLVPNELYYKGRPHLDRVVFRVMTDEVVRLTALKSGDVDLVEGISAVYYQELQNHPFIRLILVPERGYTYIGWNLTNPLFQSKKVRQALTIALNREAIIERYLSNFGEICNSPIMPQIWAYNRKIKSFPYSIEKSKQMLEEEGWKDTDGDGYIDKDGKKFSFTIIAPVNNSTRVAIATYIKEQYKQIGIEVIVRPMEWNAFIDETYKRKYEARIAAWQTDFTFPSTMKSLWYSKTADQENSFNVVSYKNSEVDELIDKGARTLDQKEAKIIWDKMQEIIYDDQPYTFLFTRKMIHGFNKRVRGIENVDIRGTYRTLEDWWIPVQERKEKM